MSDHSDVPRLRFAPADAASPPASELIAAMVEEMAPLYGRIDAPGSPTATPADLSPPGGACLVGFDANGEPVAVGGVKRLADGLGEIKRMYVAPGSRGQGAGRELLAALEDAARGLGYTRVRLDTGAHQHGARELYRAAGYVEIADYNGNRNAAFWGEKALW